ncbi:MAG: hypothetical protein P1P86_09215 [Bacteroidales bacterium]|nr:hypothetical protein [Bacteroidales bacterium]
MKSIDLEAIKTTWKGEKGFEVRRLSETDIENYLGKRSRDISQLFRKGLIIDLFLKSLIGLSLAGILILFHTNLKVVLMSSAILLGTIWTIRYQWKMIGKIPKAEASDPVIRTTLMNKLDYYHQRFIKSLYVGALSNALIILSGMLYYFYFKYGGMRPFTWDDYLVFGSTIILGYALGAYVQIAHYNFQIIQLESCLQEIDEEAITTRTIRDQRNKKRRLTLIFALALICGLLLLAYFIS